MAEEATKEEEKVEEEVQNEEEDGLTSQQEPDGDSEEEAAEAAEEEPSKEETPAFKLDSQKEPPSAPDEDDGEIFEITHLGQVHRLTKEKTVELAQKGFDYDHKVGPHGKIARMIEADPEMAQVLHDAWHKKYQAAQPGGTEKQGAPTLEVKPLNDYENEGEWLKANLESAIGVLAAQQKQAQPAQPVQQQGPNLVNMLMMRDPENFNMVMSKLPEYVGQLNVQTYRKIDSDLPSFCKFYDYVKGDLLAKAGKQQQTTVQKRKKPSFKMSSGGGSAPKQEGADYAWNLPKDKFEEALAKAKSG